MLRPRTRASLPKGNRGTLLCEVAAGSHEAFQVLLYAAGEGFEVIPAFEEGDEAALAVLAGDSADFFGEDGKVALREGEVGEGVVFMGIEACTDEDEVGAEMGEGGEELLV